MIVKYTDGATMSEQVAGEFQSSYGLLFREVTWDLMVCVDTVAIALLTAACHTDDEGRYVWTLTVSLQEPEFIHRFRVEFFGNNWAIVVPRDRDGKWSELMRGLKMHYLPWRVEETTSFGRRSGLRKGCLDMVFNPGVFEASPGNPLPFLKMLETMAGNLTELYRKLFPNGHPYSR